jgi:hypothetical protein
MLAQDKFIFRAIEAAAVAEQARAVEAERKGVETEISDLVAKKLDADLGHAFAKLLPKLPSERTRARHYDEFRKFSGWVQTLGVTALPVRAEIVAYRIMLLAGDGASFPDICRQVAAIEFMHDVNEAYLHRAPIKAALEWAKRCISQRKPKTGNGAAAEG